MGGYGTPQQSNAVGQRRPPVSSSFVPGGQLSGSQHKPPISKGLPPQQRLPHTPQRPNQPGGNFNPQSQTVQAATVQQPPTQVQSQPPTNQQPRTPVPVIQQKPPVATPLVAPKPEPAVVDPVPAAAETPKPPSADASDESMDVDPKKKFFWKKANKISKAEKLRKRNLRLSKILQPKSAIMILNELVKGCSYNVEELPVKTDAAHFRSIVNFDGQEFAGTGRTKSLARNAAAERALKYLVKNRKVTTIKKEDDDGDEKMDVDGEDGQALPWSHIASFAMYKLFSTWGEDRLFQKDSTDASGGQGLKVNAGPKEPKPAKKMPENPETMNPLMLIHQMMPNATWEEVESRGNPPNVTFTFSLTVDGNETSAKKFTGSGSSKKAAKKLAAFAACHEVLQVQYPADMWTPVVSN